MLNTARAAKHGLLYTSGGMSMRHDRYALPVRLIHNGLKFFRAKRDIFRAVADG